MPDTCNQPGSTVGDIHSALFHQLPQSVLIFDASGSIIDCTDQFIIETGFTRSQMIGTKIAPISELITETRQRQPKGSDIREFQCSLRTASDESIEVSLTVEQVHVDSECHFVATLVPTEALDSHKIERELLDILYRKGSTSEFTRDISLFLKSLVGCDRVQLRGVAHEKDVLNRFFDPNSTEPPIRRLARNDQEPTPLQDQCAHPAEGCMLLRALAGCEAFGNVKSTPNGSIYFDSYSELTTTLGSEAACPYNHQYCLTRESQSVLFVRLSADQEALGLLQFDDHRETFFKQDVIRQIERLAPLISGAFALRRRLDQAEEVGQKLKFAVDSAKVGLWELDLKTNVARFSPEYMRQIGYVPGEIEASLQSWKDRVHPDDLDQALDKVYAYIDDPTKGYQSEFRYRHRDGSYLWIVSQASLIFDEENKPVGLIGSHIDITDFKRVELAQQRSEQNLRRAQHLAHIGSWDLDIEDGTANWSDELFHIHGLNISDGVPHWSRYLSFVHPEDRERVNHHVEVALSNAKTYELEYRIIHPVEGIRWVYSIGDCLTDENGKVIRLSGTVQDIHDQKRTQLAKDELENRYSQLFYQMSEAFIYCKVIFENDQPVDYMHIDANRAFSVITGFENVVGKHITEVLPGIKEACPEFFERHGRVALTGVPESFELYIEPFDRWFRFSVYRPEKGYIVAVFQDITDRIKTQLELKASEALLKEAQHQAHLGHYVYDIATDSWTSSEALDHVFGIGPDYPRSAQGWLELVPQKQRSKMRHHLLDHVITRHNPFDMVYQIKRHDDGRLRWVHGLGRLDLDEDGKALRMLGTIQDVTERVKANQRIQKLNKTLEQRVLERTAQLESANQELESFAYSISHDLRAPLRAIDGFARILAKDYENLLDEDGRDFCTSISANARRMGQLIDDLLTFSRIGRSTLERSVVDMKMIACGVYQELSPDHSKAPVSFNLDEIPPIVADPSLMRQVWQNLISNAVKFTSKRDQPLIHISAQQGDNEIIYSITDNGAGFDSRYADRLFGVFQRLHKSAEFEGTGVGLAIVHRIITRHNGRVWAEGEVDHGATISFSLPIA